MTVALISRTTPRQQKWGGPRTPRKKNFFDRNRFGGEN
jgi:hypothetical protein